jgi:tetratricopeptide (TPR) repeat protein
LLALITGLAPWHWASKAGAALAIREKPNPKVIYQDESQYCYIAVEQASENPDHRLFMQDKLKHSEIIMGDILNLQYFYSRIYAVLTHYLGPEKRKLSVMMIGGGGYVYPRYVEKMWPSSSIDVVEIDPAVTKAAIEAFGLEKATSIRTFHMDARNFVDELSAKEAQTGQSPRYDFIYGDAFNDYSVPYQLTTKEFNDKIFRLLSEEGTYLINLIDIFDSGMLLGAMINTLEQTFPYVYVFSETGQPHSGRNTFIVAASKRLIDVAHFYERYKSRLRMWHLDKTEIDGLKTKANNLILTDDYAPVENLLVPAVRESGKIFLARGYEEKAAELARQGIFDKAIDFYKLYMRTDPAMTVRACKEISRLLHKQGKYDQEIEIFRKAIEYNTQAEFKVPVADIHFNLGVALRHSGKNQEASQELEKAAQDFGCQLIDEPKSLTLLTNLGHALAENGEYEEATKVFKQAFELYPADVPACLNLAKVLEIQNRFDEAIVALDKCIEVMSRLNRQEVVIDLRKYREFLEFQKSK